MWFTTFCDRHWMADGSMAEETRLSVLMTSSSSSMSITPRHPNHSCFCLPYGHPLQHHSVGFLDSSNEMRAGQQSSPWP